MTPSEIVGQITVSQIIGWLVFIIGFWGSVFLIWKKIAPSIKVWHEFIEDWRGESARPGREKRKGVMEKLDDLHYTQNRHSVALKELFPNHGSSIKDKVADINDRLEVVETLAPILEALVTHLNLKELDKIETKKEARTFMELVTEEKRAENER